MHHIPPTSGRGGFVGGSSARGQALPVTRGHHHAVIQIRRRPCSSVVKAASSGSFSSTYTCPYEILGVDPTADESSIKHAYRRMAKQFHPDVNKDGEAKFISIGEAYHYLAYTRADPFQSQSCEWNAARSKQSLILCDTQINKRGKGTDDGSEGGGNSAAFHDWYWSFRMSRTWDRQKQGNANPSNTNPSTFASQPETKEQLHGQISGLKHRAAMRKQRVHRDPAASAAASDDSASPTSSAFAAASAQEASQPLDHHSYQQQHEQSEQQHQPEQHEQPEHQQQHELSEEDPLQGAMFVSAWEGTNDSASDPTPYLITQQLPHQQQQQRYSSRQQRFSGSSQERRERLTDQLSGMKRRAVIKKQMQEAQ